MSKLLTLPQAAERLGVAHGTLVVQARRGKLRASKYGPVWLVSPEEVERYRRENRRGVVVPLLGQNIGVMEPAHGLPEISGPAFGSPRPAPKPGRKR